MSPWMKSIDTSLHEKLSRLSPRQLPPILLSIFLIFYGIHLYLSNRPVTQPFRPFEIKEIRIQSPFSRTLAFIRWNSPHLSRIPLMEKYRPFFSELHYSIPKYTSQLNYTADGYVPIACPYKMVSETMSIILNRYPRVQGLLFFHFDAWINPFQFDQMNFENIWFLDGPLPPFRCVTDRKGWEWWAWDQGFHLVAKNATQLVHKHYPNRYIINKDLFCGGWSDIYYIPRRFFRAFIQLSDIFYAAGSFHEIAIPTMVNIIDQTYRSTPFHTVISRMNDCWGHCCASGSTPNDILSRRCGHRMDLANGEVKQSFVQLLTSQATFLNRTMTRIPRK